MQKYLTELVGTFLFVLLISHAVNAGAPLAALFVGLALMALVYMGGWISGAHYNPAVSLAALIRGALPAKDFVPYVLAQVVGGAAGGLVASRIFMRTFMPAPGKDASLQAALAAECIFTFMLALVVLNVATTKKTAGNSYYGAAIGMTVATAAYGAGGISGGVFNPAVAIGAFAGTGGNFPSYLAYYILVQLLGAAIAAIFFKIQSRNQE